MLLLRWIQLRITTALLALVVLGAAALAGDDRPAIYDPWLEVGGYTGFDNDARGETVMWLPLTQDPRQVLFADLRGQFFQGDIQEGNFALGYRKMLSKVNLGGWVGADVRHTSANNLFWQTSGGLEALSEYFDARVNGYVPISDAAAGDGSMTEIVLAGNNIVMVGGEEVPLHGVDGEAGARMALSGLNAGVYGGGYWYDASDADQAVAGGKARAEIWADDLLTPGARISARYEFTYDDVRQDRHQVGLLLRLPIGAASRSTASMSALEQRMSARIERDTDIITGPSESEAVIDEATGVRIDRVAFADDRESMHDAVALGANTLIVATDDGDGLDLLDHDGDVFDTIALRERQTVQGGGSTLTYRGAKTGRRADWTAPGQTPEFFYGADGGSVNQNIVFDLASHNHISGIDLLSRDDLPSTKAVFFNIGENKENIVIENTKAKNSIHDGFINIGNYNKNIIIKNNESFGSSDFTIKVGKSNDNIYIINNILSAKQSDIILRINDENNNITIDGNTMGTLAEIATSVGTVAPIMSLGSDNTGIKVSRNQFQGSLSQGNPGLRNGLHIEGGGNKMTVTENTFSFLGSTGPNESTGSNLLVSGSAIIIEGDTANTVTLADNIFAGIIEHTLLVVHGDSGHIILDQGGNRTDPGLTYGKICEVSSDNGFVNAFVINGQDYVAANPSVEQLLCDPISTGGPV